MTSIMMIDITAHRRFSAAARFPIDPRWPAVAAVIQYLGDARRRSLRIIDAECGDGRLLLQAARHARALGFTAIEALGIDADPLAIRSARAAAAKLRDPAIGLRFAAGDLLAELADEAQFPADILLWEGSAGLRPHIADAAAAAARIVIGGVAPRARQRAAA